MTSLRSLAIGPGGSRRVVAAVLTLVGGLFVAEGAVNRYVTRTTEATSRRLEQDSIRSVELLARVAHDVDRERILIDDHIAASDGVPTSAIERELAAVAADLELAMKTYATLVELSKAAPQWQRAQALASRYQAAVRAALELSRANLDADARAKMFEARADYADLARTLTALLELNRSAALAAIRRIEEVEDDAERVAMVVRATAFVGVVLLGWWLVRRVTAYERELQRSASELELRNRDLDAFAGRVAHDVKNALGPIALSMWMLRKPAAAEGKGVEIAGRIERSLAKATTIVDALLAFSRASHRPEAGEHAPLRPIVSEVLEELAPLVQSVGAEVLADDCPDLSVGCDPGLLHVVLANLVSNAVKYLEGQRERVVQISARREGPVCAIEVADSGPGIPEEARELIFEPFYRGEGVRVAGSGIGLATVRRILEARGGHVTVDSTLGRGSVFRVSLPLAPDARVAANAFAPPPPAS